MLSGRAHQIRGSYEEEAHHAKKSPEGTGQGAVSSVARKKVGQRTQHVNILTADENCKQTSILIRMALVFPITVFLL